jgi:hypothetical protein
MLNADCLFSEFFPLFQKLMYFLLAVQLVFSDRERL